MAPTSNGQGRVRRSARLLQLEQASKYLGTVRRSARLHVRAQQRLRTNIQSFIAESKEKDRQINDERRKVRERRVQLRRSTALVEQQRKQLQNTQDELDRVSASAEQQRREHEATEQRLERTAAQLEERTTEFQTTEELLGTTTAQLEERTTQLQNTQRRLGTTITERDAQRRELQNTQRRFDAQTTQLQNTQGQLQTTITERDAQRRELQNTQRQLDAQRIQLQNTQHRFNAQTTQFQNIQRQLQTTITQLEEQGRRAQAAEAELAEQRRQAQAAAADLQNFWHCVQEVGFLHLDQWAKEEASKLLTFIYTRRGLAVPCIGNPTVQEAFNAACSTQVLWETDPLGLTLCAAQQHNKATARRNTIAHPSTPNLDRRLARIVLEEFPTEYPELGMLLENMAQDPRFNPQPQN